ncbi:ParE family toxin-like protein [Nostoc sp.]|uniref:ParE family toxin-like protein n=1 Tax=Nostoc sp. TaxID=1180 RepID=UPI002FF55994
MKSRITAQFRQEFGELPEQIQEQTREAYRLFKQDPSHPSLRFKKVHPELAIYSARISKNYRAVGQLNGDTVIWFWLGSHAEYNKLLSGL